MKKVSEGRGNVFWIIIWTTLLTTFASWLTNDMSYRLGYQHGIMDKRFLEKEYEDGIETQTFNRHISIR